MKRLLVVLLLVLLMAACTPAPVEEQAIQTSSAVDIPEQIEVGFAGVLIALWTAGFTYIFERTGVDLRGYAVPLGALLATICVTIGQSWINVQDPSLDPTIILVLRVLGALLTGAGTLRLFSKQPATLLPNGGMKVQG